MNIISFIRLFRKHIILVMLTSLLLAGMMTLLTKKPKFIFASQTTLYTGLATGSSIEMDKSFNYFATNTAFDNLINIINSRETQQDVAIRLLSQHLLLKKADPKFISAASFEQLKKIAPATIYAGVEKLKADTSLQVNIKDEKEPASAAKHNEPAATTQTDSVTVNTASALFPASIDRDLYERTVKMLTDLMNSSDTNFVYKLLNFENPHYSIKAISTVKAVRIANSDLIRLSYEVDDPGICQQTLAIFNEVCISNYKSIKENRSDAVVKYFESQLGMAEQKLKMAEDKLLEFNKSNNIINYYEQSKAVAVVKEDMEVDYNNKKAQLAGTDASIKRLEDKLNIQQQVQLKSSNILEKKQRLGDLNFQIAAAEADQGNAEKVTRLRIQAQQLTEEIRNSVSDLYAYQNTTDGLPVSRVLNEWISNVVESENLRAKLRVMDQNNKDFQNQYAIYAPAGANIKRIEREISVSEQGYLEILHGLNLAKLKLQDNELTSNLKAVDPPYFPLTPTPMKRKVLIIAAALIGAILVLGIILALEYFDDTLKNTKRAAQKIKLPSIGMLPKIFLNPGILDFDQVRERLLEITIQQMQQGLTSKENGKSSTKTIIFCSTTEHEGKTVTAGNMARKLISQGKKVIFLNYSENQTYTFSKSVFPFFNRILGYHDPRVDTKSSYLKAPASYLPSYMHATYKFDDQFLSSRDYTDVLDRNGIDLPFIPDYVFIEIPALVKQNHPTELLANADLSVLICRANRIWGESDQHALNGILKYCGDKACFLINGAELAEVESVLGDLPKKRNIIRKKIKNLLRFQIFSNNRI